MSMVRGLGCGRGAFFSILRMPFLDLVFFKSESNVRHRPCPWFGAFGHLLARRSGVVGARFLASWGCHSGVAASMVGSLRAPPGTVFWCGRGAFFGILGMPFWTLFSSSQKATLSTGRVHGLGPSGPSWQGVLVW